MRFDIILMVGLILSPLFLVLNRTYGAQFSNRQQYEIFFQFFVIIAFALTFWMKSIPQRRSKNRWMGAFLIWAAISFLSHPTIAVGDKLIPFWPISHRYLLNIFWAGILLFLISKYVQEGWIPGILKTMCFVSILMVGFIAMQAMGLWPIRIGDTIIGQPLNPYGQMISMKDARWWAYGFPGLLGHRTLTAAQLGMTAPLFLIYGRVKRFPLGLVIILAGLVATRGVMGIISAFAGIMFYEWFRSNRNKKRIKIEVASAIVAIGLIAKYGHTPCWDSRWEALQYVFQRLSLFGHGLGSFPFAGVGFNPKDMSSWMAQAHNEYAQVLYVLGIVGLVIVLGYMATRFERFLFMEGRSKKLIAIMACLTALFVNCIGNFTFHHAVLALSGLTLVGFADIYLYSGKGGRDEEMA